MILGNTKVENGKQYYYHQNTKTNGRFYPNVLWIAIYFFIIFFHMSKHAKN